MIFFWLATGLLAALAAGAMIWRASSAAAGEGDAALAVSRRQLAELEDLRARGLLDEEGFRSARAEAARRLLGEAERGESPERPAGPGQRRAVLAAAGATALAALGLYLAIGSPGAPDQPYAERVEAWAEDLESLDPPRLAAVAAAVAQERPDDAEAWTFLGRARAAAGEPLAAVQAFQRALRLKPDDATLWSYLGEAFVQAQQGVVGGDARMAFEQALARDPSEPAARYFLGRADIADGRVERGLARWRGLAADLSAGDPRRAGLEAEIAAVTQGDAAPKVDAGMIQGMVDGLAARLAQAPDDAQGWARLIRAYGVLGQDAARAEAIRRARAQFAGRPAELALVEAAVAEPK